MILESIVLVGGFMATAILGAPLAALLARPEDWSKEKDLAREDRVTTTGVAGFEPLDLGPDLMRWPSEVERPITKMPAPEWPSKSWDDPHFGAHWRQSHYEEGAHDAAYDAKLAERRLKAREKAAANQQQSKRREEKKETENAEEARQLLERQEEAARTRSARLEPQKAASSEVEQQFFRENATKQAKAQVQKAKKHVTQAAHKAVSEAVGAEIPSPAELEAMVGQLGLAGTVQEIMKRTNWDFRKAAHYLAKARQQR